MQHLKHCLLSHLSLWKYERQQSKPWLDFLSQNCPPSLDADYVSSGDFESKFKDYTKCCFCFTSKY